VETTLAIGRWVVNHENFRTGNFDTNFIPLHFKPEHLKPVATEREISVAAAVLAKLLENPKPEFQNGAEAKSSAWRRNRLQD
jgi:hypothetical protein